MYKDDLLMILSGIILSLIMFACLFLISPIITVTVISIACFLAVPIYLKWRRDMREANSDF